MAEPRATIPIFRLLTRWGQNNVITPSYVPRIRPQTTAFTQEAHDTGEGDGGDDDNDSAFRLSSPHPSPTAMTSTRPAGRGKANTTRERQKMRQKTRESRCIPKYIMGGEGAEWGGGSVRDAAESAEVPGSASRIRMSPLHNHVGDGLREIGGPSGARSVDEKGAGGRKWCSLEILQPPACPSPLWLQERLQFAVWRERARG